MSRSHLVFAAKKVVANHYELCRMAAKGTRAMHLGNAVRNVRLADTLNQVFIRLAKPEEASSTVCLVSSRQPLPDKGTPHPFDPNGAAS